MSSIDLHGKLHDRVGIEEQHGDDKSENDMSVKCVSMLDSRSTHQECSAEPIFKKAVPQAS